MKNSDATLSKPEPATCQTIWHQAIAYFSLGAKPQQGDEEAMAEKTRVLMTVRCRFGFKEKLDC
ncbi:hypothetical protein V2J09_017878 [Rumex salicifolius]